MAAILSGIFGGAVRLRNSLYDSGTLSARRLQGPVISVGNVSVGGSGKTPFVILLGELLKSRGIAFDVLSRGYRRQTRGAVIVDPAGLPRDFGDEPLLIARRLQCPVVLGELRYEAGCLAEQRFGPRLHLLDDGFQHRQLARDFDIVLVTPDDARDRLLPAGRLREPLTALGRADAVVLSSGADPAAFPLEGKPTWRIRRSIVTDNLPAHPVVFCGIARPQAFFAQLRKAGVDLAAEVVFADHHAYAEKDLRDLQYLAEQNHAGGFVTTEKDAVNLAGYMSSLRPLAVVPVKLAWPDASLALDFILETLKSRGQPVS